MESRNFDRGSSLSIFASDRREDLSALIFAFAIAVAVVVFVG